MKMVHYVARLAQNGNDTTNTRHQPVSANLGQKHQVILLDGLSHFRSKHRSDLI